MTQEERRLLELSTASLRKVAEIMAPNGCACHLDQHGDAVYCTRHRPAGSRIVNSSGKPGLTQSQTQ